MEATTVAPEPRDPSLDDLSLDDLSATELLGAARQHNAMVQRGEADLLAVAYQWAIAHPAGEDGGDAAAFSHVLGDEPISGDGTPLVAELCVAELGAALGVSTDAAKKLIGARDRDGPPAAAGVAPCPGR